MNWWILLCAAWRRFWILEDAGPIVPATRLVAQLELPDDAPTVEVIMRKWIALRSGGGGRFETPVLAENDALEYVTRRGSHAIVHVDSQNGFIFYRDTR